MQSKGEGARGKSSDPVLEHFKVTVICVDLARCFHAASA